MFPSLDDKSAGPQVRKKPWKKHEKTNGSPPKGTWSCNCFDNHRCKASKVQASQVLEGFNPIGNKNPRALGYPGSLAISSYSNRQLGSSFPIYGKITNVPNHQPVIYIPCSSFFRDHGRKHGETLGALELRRHEANGMGAPKANTPGDHNEKMRKWWVYIVHVCFAYVVNIFR